MLLGRIAVLAGLFATTGADAVEDATAPGLTLDRVVVVMRHGVRPPTKPQPLPKEAAAQPWPAWGVAPGWLTPHGAAAVAAIAAADRRMFVAAGLLPRSGCAGRVALLADSDERTIATAEHYAAALVPGCTPAIEHRPQDQADPLFSQVESGRVTLDPARAAAAVDAATGPGGIAAVAARAQPLLARLDAVLCGAARPDGCGIAHLPTTLAPATATARPKLGGALDRASTAAQVLLLEYADGKPAADVGWGRATPDDIAALGAFHALEFHLLARPRYLAAANFAGLAPRVAAWLSDDTAAATRVALIAGHDTNVANLAGLLDVHWQVPGMAADDPAPGGAIVLERLSDAAGRHFVRAVYRAQTLAELRTGTARALYRQPLPIAGCRARGVAGLCALADFAAKLAVR